LAVIYSALIWQDHAVPSDDTHFIDLPSDVVTIIRDMDVFLAGVGGGAFSVWDDALCTFWSVQSPEGGTGVWEHWSGRQVFPPGGRLYFKPSLLDPLGTADLRISGYRLTPP
jgi:hypothetical protein